MHYKEYPSKSERRAKLVDFFTQKNLRGFLRVLAQLEVSARLFIPTKPTSCDVPREHLEKVQAFNALFWFSKNDSRSVRDRYVEMFLTFGFTATIKLAGYGSVYHSTLTPLHILELIKLNYETIDSELITTIDMLLFEHHKVLEINRNSLCRIPAPIMSTNNKLSMLSIDEFEAWVKTSFEANLAVEIPKIKQQLAEKKIRAQKFIGEWNNLSWVHPLPASEFDLDFQREELQLAREETAFRKEIEALKSK